MTHGDPDKKKLFFVTVNGEHRFPTLVYQQMELLILAHEMLQNKYFYSKIGVNNIG